MNAMSLHQEAFNHIPVNFYPKPRAMRNLDCAVFNFNSFTNKCITEKIFREIVLYHRLIREKCKWCGRDVGNKLQSGCNTDSGSPHMGDQLNHIRLRKGQDFLSFGEAAHNAQIGLQNIYRPSFEPFLIVVLGILLFAGSQICFGEVFQLRISGSVFR